MAAKPNKAITPPEAVEQIAANDLDFEGMIADEILDNLDWGKIKIAIFSKVKQRFFAWLTTGIDRPINLSQFPELAALPSSEGEGA